MVFLSTHLSRSVQLPAWPKTFISIRLDQCISPPEYLRAFLHVEILRLIGSLGQCVLGCLGLTLQGRGLGDRLRKVTRLQRPLTRRFSSLKGHLRKRLREIGSRWQFLYIAYASAYAIVGYAGSLRRLTRHWKIQGLRLLALDHFGRLLAQFFPAVQLSQVVQVVRADDERVPSLRTGSLSLVYPRWS